MRVLGLQPDPSNPFSPSVLFEALANAVPQTTTAASTPTRTDIALLSPDIEEADKVHWLGWKVHATAKSGVTQKNLEKTLRLCGLTTYEYCRQHNISSCWTADQSKATPYRQPRVI